MLLKNFYINNQNRIKRIIFSNAPFTDPKKFAKSYKKPQCILLPNDFSNLDFKNDVLIKKTNS